MIETLGRRSLEQRRAIADLCLFYKIVHGLVAVPLPRFIQLNTRISRYCHSMTFRQPHTTTDCYLKVFIFPVAVVQWNALPESVVCCQALKLSASATFQALDLISLF